MAIKHNGHLTKALQCGVDQTPCFSAETESLGRLGAANVLVVEWPIRQVTALCVNCMHHLNGYVMRGRVRLPACLQPTREKIVAGEGEMKSFDCTVVLNGRKSC